MSTHAHFANVCIVNIDFEVSLDLKSMDLDLDSDWVD